MARPHTQTLLFTEPATAIATMKVLVGSGMETSRISIQTWGHRIAIRPRDAIDRAALDQIVAVGGEIVSDPEADLLPNRATQEPDAGMLLEAVI